jgi:hypothetical protein
MGCAPPRLCKGARATPGSRPWLADSLTPDKVDVPLEKRDDLMDEIESWPIYAVLELVAQSAAAPPDDVPDDSDLDESEDAAQPPPIDPPPSTKKKKAGRPAAGESAKKMGKTKA